ncbi:hypothetical protein BLNAU_15740 [Blattamonas nauphoetae]|uniref:Tyrosine specific protein phosphatases domain-containing protein n=1 Tax=Blattamonas nauphoetae TaxID=2049346 RepID=A0ABQ9XGQ9_9EUKA|nr:hypothetical protein BLNAU_15740 [Blattamonas nauphoetae]
MSSSRFSETSVLCRQCLRGIQTDRNSFPKIAPFPNTISFTSPIPLVTPDILCNLYQMNLIRNTSPDVIFSRFGFTGLSSRQKLNEAHSIYQKSQLSRNGVVEGKLKSLDVIQTPPREYQPHKFSQIVMDDEDDGWRQQSYTTASSAAYGARLGKKPASQQRVETSPQKSTPIRDPPIIIRPPLEPLQPELDDAPLLTEDSPVRSFHSSPQKSGLESSVSIQNPLLLTITSDTFAGPLPNSNWVIPGHLLIGGHPGSNASRLLQHGVDMFVNTMTPSEAKHVRTNVGQYFESAVRIIREDQIEVVKAQMEYERAVQLNAVKKSKLPASAFAMKKGKNFLNDAQTAKAPSEVIIPSRKYKQGLDELAYLPFPIADGSAPTERDCCDLVEWLCNAIVEQKKCVFLHSLEGHGRVGLLAGLVLARLFHAAPTRILSFLQRAHKCRVDSPEVACPSTHEQKMLLYRLASVFDQPITETQRLQSCDRISARITETGLSVAKKLTAQQTRPQSAAVSSKSSSRGNRLSETMNSNVSIVNSSVLLNTPISQGIVSVTLTILTLPRKASFGVLRFCLLDSTAPVPKLRETVGCDVQDSVSLSSINGKLYSLTPSRPFQHSAKVHHYKPKEGDCVRMEVDMDSTPRRLQFFVNGQQGRFLVSGLPPSVKIGFTVWIAGTSIRIDRIVKLTQPTPITPEMRELWW